MTIDIISIVCANTRYSLKKQTVDEAVFTDSVYENDFIIPMDIHPLTLYTLLTAREKIKAVKSIRIYRTYLQELRSLLIAVSAASGISIEELQGESRKREIVDARKVFCSVARELYPKAPLSIIGRTILKDHATVIHNLKECLRVKEVMNALEDIRKGILHSSDFYRYSVEQTEMAEA